MVVAYGRWSITVGSNYKGLGGGRKWRFDCFNQVCLIQFLCEVVTSVCIPLDWPNVDTTWHMWERVLESWTSCSWCSAFCRGRNETIGSYLFCVITVTFSAGLGTRNEGRRWFRGSLADNSRRDIQDLAVVLFVFAICAKAADVVKNILNARLNSFDLNT